MIIINLNGKNLVIDLNMGWLWVVLDWEYLYVGDWVEDVGNFLCGVDEGVVVGGVGVVLWMVFCCGLVDVLYVGLYECGMVVMVFGVDDDWL